MRYILIAVLLLAGCEQNIDRPTETFTPDESEYKLCLVVDMSLSFDRMMAEGGKAYDALLTLIDTYFRDRIGSSDRLILAQISAKRPSLIWEGSPQDLRSEFDPQKFAGFLHEHAEPSASPVILTIAESLEFLMSDPSVASGKTKPVFIVLSDMADTMQKTPELKDRILRDLKDYGKLNGTFGIYYCDQEYFIPWKKVLNDAGIKKTRVECGIVSKVDPPSFE